MTIASAFNDIAVAQGGTASKSGSIASAIDALNDALAGSDQPAAQTIEDAVTLLGQHIGGGGGKHDIKYATFDFDSTWTEVTAASVYPTTVYDDGYKEYGPIEDADPIAEAATGEVVCLDYAELMQTLGLDEGTEVGFAVGDEHAFLSTLYFSQGIPCVPMPDDTLWVVADVSNIH